MSVVEPRELIEMLSQLEHWQSEAPAIDPRAYRRYMIRCDGLLEAIVQTPHEQAMHNVMLRDISFGGVGFLAEEPVERGSYWRLHLYNPSYRVGSQPLCVRYCRLVQDGLYLVGGQYVIEPFALAALGVDPQQLADDVQTGPLADPLTDFVPPQSLDDSAEP